MLQPVMVETADYLSRHLSCQDLLMVLPPQADLSGYMSAITQSLL